MRYHSQQSGFALLITLIVVGVILSIGLTLLDLSIKQVRLSSNAKESESAFHAANAGVECARYWRRSSSTEMELGQAISPRCFEVTPDTNTNTELLSGVTGDGEVYQYIYNFSWGTVAPRCTEITTLVMVADPGGGGVTLSDVPTLVPGYPDGDDKECEAGARCTVISVRGYNKPCSATGGYGVVQREVLLQF